MFSFILLLFQYIQEPSCLKCMRLKSRCTPRRRTTRSWRPSTISLYTSSPLSLTLSSSAWSGSVEGRCIWGRGSSRRLTQTSSRPSRTTTRVVPPGAPLASSTLSSLTCSWSQGSIPSIRRFLFFNKSFKSWILVFLKIYVLNKGLRESCVYYFWGSWISLF